MGKINKIIFAVLVITAINFGCHILDVYAQTNASLKGNETKRVIAPTLEKDRKQASKIRSVKVVYFTLKNGKLVSGRVISEDRYEITAEQVDGSSIFVSTYIRDRDIERETLRYKTVSELAYCEDVAEYFANRTWDFKDDPDDFLHAIRFYKKAKQLVTKAGYEDSKKAAQIENKIEQLEADRQVWVKETEARAELKDLEFRATFDVKLKELEDEIRAIREQLPEIRTGINNNYERLQEAFYNSHKDLELKLEKIGQGVELNKQEIDRLWHRYRHLPRYPPRRPTPYKPEKSEEQKQAQ